jgi:hypothetical protein
MSILDLLAGIGLLVTAVALRRSTRLAALAAAAGLLWFLGDLVGPLAFAHRGPLTHLLLVYPGVPKARLSWQRVVVIGAAYLTSAIYPVGRLGFVTIAMWVMVLLCLRRTPIAERYVEDRIC